MNGVMQQSLRRFANRNPAAFSRLGAPATSTALALQQKRVASTAVNEERISIDAGHEILVQQRLRRPVAPHLGIYKPQITWYGSGFNRITGTVLSGAFYIFGFGYLVQPLLGVHIFESSSIIGAFAGMALLAKVPLKFTAAFFFNYHCWAGIKHLVWDAGKAINNQAVIRSGWAVVGVSAVLSAWMAFM